MAKANASKDNKPDKDTSKGYMGPSMQTWSVPVNGWTTPTPPTKPLK